MSALGDRGRAAVPLGPAGLLLLIVALFPATAHAAPQVKPWLPTGMDSLEVWAARARAGFRTNTGDSIGGTNIEPYVQVGKIARHLLASLGSSGLMQAKAIEPVIDSLGLDVEVAVDPTYRTAAIVMVRNPFRFSAEAIGFLYWYRMDQIHYQGVKFNTGRNVIMRVWRTRFSEEPYSWAVLENTRFGSLPLEFTLLRLAPTGLFWNAKQYTGNGIDLGGRGDAAFVDLNNDGVPEVVSWTHDTEDSTFITCPECPKLLKESTWAERFAGYEPLESRLVPSAFANLVALIHYLRDGNRAAASRLVVDPALVTRALADGWGKAGGPGSWRVINVEPDETWPHWMIVRHGRGTDVHSWVVHFTLREGRWIVRDWVEEKPQVQAR